MGKKQIRHAESEVGMLQSLPISCIFFFGFLFKSQDHGKLLQMEQQLGCGGRDPGLAFQCPGTASPVGGAPSSEECRDLQSVGQVGSHLPCCWYSLSGDGWASGSSAPKCSTLLPSAELVALVFSPEGVAGAAAHKLPWLVLRVQQAWLAGEGSHSRWTDWRLGSLAVSVSRPSAPTVLQSARTGGGCHSAVGPDHAEFCQQLWTGDGP